MLFTQLRCVGQDALENFLEMLCILTYLESLSPDNRLYMFYVVRTEVPTRYPDVRCQDDVN